MKKFLSAILEILAYPFYIVAVVLLLIVVILAIVGGLFTYLSEIVLE